MRLDRTIICCSWSKYKRVDKKKDFSLHVVVVTILIRYRYIKLTYFTVLFKKIFIGKMPTIKNIAIYYTL